jgi:hypothetical protein
MSRCKKLLELPPVFTDWQQTARCPDCDHYNGGICGNPIGRDGNVACPFDDKVVPLREVAVEVANHQPSKPLDAVSCEVPQSPPRSKALEQAINDRIVSRTGRRIQALEIERTDQEVVIRGRAPCYYVKQLALQGVLDVLHSDQETKVGFDFQVVVCPPGPTELTAPARRPSSSPEPV